MKTNILLSTLISAFVLAGSGAMAQTTPEQSGQPQTSVPAQTTSKHRLGVGTRMKIQQARIKEGIKNGTLTRSEAKNLEMHEAGIATDAKIDRAENGGKLTPAERNNLEKRENRQSARIYRKKHNARNQQ
ncbi:MAG: hypothetical protein Q8916_06025 [Bacteroidota bacterium]|nr:hypothetical protein [Bacteroidota bacterium]MDP4229946.1 hypothetical protein [Bacteroidota bacterium]MDP4235641.1 hypothetical protein [Bacteroidota bacterium]